MRPSVFRKIVIVALANIHFGLSDKAVAASKSQCVNRVNFTDDPFPHISFDRNGDMIVEPYLVPDVRRNGSEEEMNLLSRCHQTYSLLDGQSVQFRSHGFSHLSDEDMSMSSLTCFMSPHGTKIELICEDINIDCKYSHIAIIEIDGQPSIKTICDEDQSGNIQHIAEANSLFISIIVPLPSGSQHNQKVSFKCRVSPVRFSSGADFNLNSSQFPNHSMSNPSRYRRADESEEICNCGRRNYRNRALRHTVTEPHEFPWRCYLYNDDDELCGCSLISDKWVLTAAHCVHKNKCAKVILGGHKRSRGSIITTVKSKRIFSHPKFDEKELRNDIALVKLYRRVKFNREIAPVCLPWKMKDDDFKGMRAVTSGWGTTSKCRQGSKILRKICMKVVSQRKCACIFKDTGSCGLTKDMICAHEPGRGIKNGDSGGSLDVKIDGRYYAIGVTSWSVRNRRVGKTPSVFARVTKFLPWINSTTGGVLCKA